AAAPGCLRPGRDDRRLRQRHHGRVSRAVRVPAGCQGADLQHRDAERARGHRARGAPPGGRSAGRPPRLRPLLGDQHRAAADVGRRATPRDALAAESPLQPEPLRGAPAGAVRGVARLRSGRVRARPGRRRRVLHAPATRVRVDGSGVPSHPAEGPAPLEAEAVGPEGGVLRPGDLQAHGVRHAEAGHVGSGAGRSREPVGAGPTRPERPDCVARVSIRGRLSAPALACLDQKTLDRLVHAREGVVQAGRTSPVLLAVFALARVGSVAHAQPACDADTQYTYTFQSWCPEPVWIAQRSSCFATKGGGSIIRTGAPAVPGGPQGTFAGTFCIAHTDSSLINSVTGLPGPGALLLPAVATTSP